MDKMLDNIGDQLEAELGSKQTAGKLPVELLPWPAVMEVVRVLEFGALKYDDWNWSKGVKMMSLCASAMRHIMKFICGADTDEESGLPHLAHAACNLLFLLHFQQTNRADLDDRPKTLAGGFEKISEPDEPKWKKYAGVGFAG